MNKGLNFVLNNYSSRYPTEEEEKAIIKYANGADFRLEVMEEMAKIEREVATESTKYMMDKYPSIDANFNDVKYKTFRDLSLILRYCSHCMLKDDPQFLNDQLLYWLKTMLKSFGFEKGALSDTYVKMDQLCKEKLETKHYKLIEPYLKIVIEVMDL